ncbi:MAG: DNA-directed DNA polymerase II small subunit [archaeon]
MIKEEEIKQNIVEIFFEERLLLGIDSLSYLYEIYNNDEDYDDLKDIAKLINDNFDLEYIWLNKDLIESVYDKREDIFNKNLKEFNWRELERAVVLYEKGLKKKPYNFFIKYLNKLLGKKPKKIKKDNNDSKDDSNEDVSIDKNSDDNKTKRVESNNNKKKEKRDMIEKVKKNNNKKSSKKKLNKDTKKKNNDDKPKSYDISKIPDKNPDDFDFKLIKKCSPSLKDVTVSDFKNHFVKRLTRLSNILRQRPELSNITSIEHIESRKDEKEIGLIGMIYGIYKTKNDNYFIEIEDRSGSYKVFVSSKEKDLVEKAENLIEDEVIGVVGRFSGNLFITDKIIFPDVPNNDMKKSDDDEYVVFTSDIHVGSNLFLEDSFNNFIDWINGDYGSDKQKEISKKVKYIFVLGDLVDGIGIYPGQQDELNIDDIYKQYEKVAELFSKIRDDIPIIVIPGNHDAVRLAEPQGGLPKDLAFDLWKMPNVFIYSNPCIINIGSNDDFSGFNVLAYHGYSYDYYVNNVDSLRLNGGYDKITNTMKFLLKKRHLSPKHGGSTYLPDPEVDDLIIDKIPDFFVSGHVHKNDVDQYKKTSLISSSTFQAKTPFQEKLGHNPDPGIVPVVSLKTREVNMFDFN